MRIIPFLGAILCSASFCPAAGAQAQTAQPAGGLVPDIIVTARGRSERSFAVPMSISVLTDQLATARLDTLADVLGAIPGVYFISDTDPGTNLIAIRGVSTNRGQAPSVTIVRDGQVVPDGELYTFKPFDLAQVAVLKGPQGALAGRAAAGGVILLQSVQPELGAGASGYARVGYGSAQAKTFEAAASVAPAGGLGLRLATSLSDDSGQIRNTTLGKKVDALQSLNVRAILTAAPGPDAMVRAIVNYAREKGGAAFVSSNNITGLFGGRLAGAALSAPIGDFEGRFDRNWFGAAVDLQVQLASGAQISLRSGYDDYAKNFVEELDFRPDKNLTFFGFPAFPNGIQPISQPVRLQAFTHEVRISSASSAPVQFTAGVFYQTVNKRRTDDFAGFGTYAVELNKTAALGLFADVTGNLADQVEAGFALRYDRERHRQATRQRNGTLDSARAGTFASLQPKFTLSYKPAAGQLLYVAVSTGFKPGGFNPASQLAPATPALFASEKTYGAELGLKQRWPGATLEVAAFATRHDNFQNTVFLDNNLVFSIPRVNIAGLEATGQVQLGHGFTLDGSVSWTRARLAAYAVANPTPETPEPVAKCQVAGNTACQFKGNRIPNSPDYAARLGAQWQGQAGVAQLTARVDINRTGRVVYEVDNVLYSPDFTSIDARLGVRLGTVEAALWGKNIAGQRRALAAFGQQSLQLLQALGPGGPFDSFTLNRGASYGATLGIQF